MSKPFVAKIRMFAFNFAPTGWARCDGQLLPISQNTALFSLLGTFYGGDGKSTFGLPDLQGSTPLHVGGSQPGPGLSIYDLGQTRGVDFVTPLDRDFFPRVCAGAGADEVAMVPWDDATKAAFVEQQFVAQCVHYAAYYPGAQVDVVLVDGQRAGRLFVHRGERDIRIVDIALLPE